MYYVVRSAADKWKRISNLPITLISAVKLLRYYTNKSLISFEDDGGATYIAIPAHSGGKFIAWAVSIKSKKDEDTYKHRIITVKRHKEMVEMFPDEVEFFEGIERPLPMDDVFYFMYKSPEDCPDDWLLYTDSRIAFPLAAVNRAAKDVTELNDNVEVREAGFEFRVELASEEL